MMFGFDTWLIYTLYLPQEVGFLMDEVEELRAERDELRAQLNVNEMVGQPEGHEEQSEPRRGGGDP